MATTTLEIGQGRAKQGKAENTHTHSRAEAREAREAVLPGASPTIRSCHASTRAGGWRAFWRQIRAGWAGCTTIWRKKGADCCKSACVLGGRFGGARVQRGRGLGFASNRMIPDYCGLMSCELDLKPTGGAALDAVEARATAGVQPDGYRCVCDRGGVKEFVEEECKWTRRCRRRQSHALAPASFGDCEGCVDV